MEKTARGRKQIEESGPPGRMREQIQGEEDAELLEERLPSLAIFFVTRGLCPDGSRGLCPDGS